MRCDWIPCNVKESYLDRAFLELACAGRATSSNTESRVGQQITYHLFGSSRNAYGVPRAPCCLEPRVQGQATRGLGFREAYVPVDAQYMNGHNTQMTGESTARDRKRMLLNAGQSRKGSLRHHSSRDAKIRPLGIRGKRSTSRERQAQRAKGRKPPVHVRRGRGQGSRARGREGGRGGGEAREALGCCKDSDF